MGDVAVEDGETVEEDETMEEASAQGRGCEQVVAEGCGDRRGRDEQAGGADPPIPNPTGRCSCSFAAGRPSSQGGAALPARMWFSICRR